MFSPVVVDLGAVIHTMWDESFHRITIKETGKRCWARKQGLPGHLRTPAKIGWAPVITREVSRLKGGTVWARPLDQIVLSVYLVEKGGNRCRTGVPSGGWNKEKETLWWSPEEVWPGFIFHEIRGLEGEKKKWQGVHCKSTLKGNTDNLMNPQTLCFPLVILHFARGRAGGNGLYLLWKYRAAQLISWSKSRGSTFLSFQLHIKPASCWGRGVECIYIYIYPHTFK